MSQSIKPQIPPPSFLHDEKAHRRILNDAIANLYQGKGPSPIDNFSLTTSATTTTLTDARIGYYSHISFMPQTAHAASVVTQMYVPQSTQLNGSAVVNHPSQANTDCTFRVLIWG
ncbi:MAG: hypothetical protein KGL35_19355 [Bradyrhizobium sp.]|nr:hypothetical protein [Bradyrhizobium sp.]